MPLPHIGLPEVIMILVKVTLILVIFAGVVFSFAEGVRKDNS